MLGCLSLHAHSPERVGAREGQGETGPNETNDRASVPASQSQGATLAGNRDIEEDVRSHQQVLASNASRRTSGGRSIQRRRSGSIRSFCKKLGKLFSGFSRRRSTSSSAASPPVHHLGLDIRTRLRNEFRQRLLAALSSAGGPTFVTAAGHISSHHSHSGLLQRNEEENGENEVEVASMLRRRLSNRSRLVRRGSGTGRSETAISESDQIWREIQEFTVSQQGDVYVYIPYTHLDEALGYLSQILPLLSHSLRQQQQQQQHRGLTIEEFDALPVVEDDAWDCSNPLDCPVCFNPMSPEQELVALPCFEDHIFHKSCLWKWLSSHQTCPLCRKEVEIPGKVEEGAAAEEEECQHDHSSLHSHQHEEEGANLPSISTSTVTDDTSDDTSDEGNSPGMAGDEGGVTPRTRTTTTATSPRRIFIWSTARGGGGSTPAMLILSRGQR